MHVNGIGAHFGALLIFFYFFITMIIINSRNILIINSVGTFLILLSI